MHYFLDTEYNGWGGALISLALVPEDGGEEVYLTLDCPDPLEPWVERNVVPYLDHVPDPMRSPRLRREEAARLIAYYLDGDSAATIIADWPEDIAQFNMLLLTGPGTMVATPPITFQLLPIPGFSTAANSAVPHNALHDARAFRDHVVSLR